MQLLLNTYSKNNNGGFLATLWARGGWVPEERVEKPKETENLEEMEKVAEMELEVEKVEEGAVKVERVEEL